MKVAMDRKYKSEFPESFPWGKVDSPKLSGLAYTISQNVIDDLRTADRNNVPGLRVALNAIAEMADI